MDKVLEARDETQKNQNAFRADLNRMSEAMREYQSMEAHYEAARSAPLPTPQR